jgi:hypothetical protein
MYGTGKKRKLLFLALLLLCVSCKKEKPVEEPKKVPEPAVILIKPKPAILTGEQQTELGFPEDIIAKVQSSAGAEAEPFFTTVLVRSENLKGDRGFEKQNLAGFSVRTKNADELIASYRSGLRVRGYLIFKSHRGYGTLADIVTVVKGNNSYDLLKMQRTEGPAYNIDTERIVAWLKERQREGSFVITGAGSDWVEAKFIKPPDNPNAFARKIYAFAPDVRLYGPQTVEKLADRIKRTKEFYLVWD